MIWHLAGVGAASLLIVACMFLPFLPGRYDGLAVTLSAVAQLFAVAGLLLVPLGTIWLAHEFRMRASKAETRPGKDMGYWFALASIAALTIVAVAVSLVALVNIGPSLGFGTLTLWAYCAYWLTARLKAMRNADVRTFNPAPLYLVILPIIAAVFMFALFGLAAEFSRNRAIRNSASLISDIERYREAHGRYPPSLLSVWKDYEPMVIGVEQYHYEPNGDAYNLYFEHLALQWGTREFVMYNNRDEHEMTSHDMDLLQLTPAELAPRRGYHAVHDASIPHWKYFWFD